jgi:hypothetical protein
MSLCTPIPAPVPTTQHYDDPISAAVKWPGELEDFIQEQRERAARAEAAAREEERSEPPPSSSGSLPDLLLFIRSNESGGDYTAYNPSGCEGYGCGGAYQMHALYADDWARRYGEGAWADTPVQQWPLAVQDRVALGLFRSTSPDGAHWCDWTDYC